MNVSYKNIEDAIENVTATFMNSNVPQEVVVAGFSVNVSRANTGTIVYRIGHGKKIAFSGIEASRWLWDNQREEIAGTRIY